MDKPKLTIQLVPKSCFYTNLTSELSKDKWDKIRKEAYRSAGYKCEICGSKGKKWPVEAHEIWKYNKEKFIQKLFGIIALCPSCHEVKHYGLATVNDREEFAFAHLCKINKWDKRTARTYVDECFEIWHERSQHKWKLDISWLEQKGIK